MNMILRALLDDEQEVFINCGDNLDWFLERDRDAVVCVVTVEENGDNHQSLVAKSRLSDIRPDTED